MRFVACVGVLVLCGAEAFSAARAAPKCVVFDLDGCLWTPEMYQLWNRGGGPPFAAGPGGTMVTNAGETVRLLGDARAVLRDLRSRGAVLGVSSCCDEPEWARELLDAFDVDGVPLTEVFDFITISKESKCAHFERASSDLGVPLDAMLFFDNEIGNCRAVSALGVTVAYAPEGVTEGLYGEALAAFPAPPGAVV